jgi:SAM-dependent methyltransferase
MRPLPDDVEASLPSSRGIPASLVITRIGSQPEFQRYRAQINAEVAARLKRESGLAQPYSSFSTPGFCFACQKCTQFLSSWELAYRVDGNLHVNWREHLLCPHCRLNNRMRASIHLLAETIAPTKESRIYATEQSSPLYRYLRKYFPFLVGSEYLQDTALIGKSDSAKLRDEDLTRLSFPSESFDVILSFDVLEHIPDYRAAFAECARTLKPTGKMLFSAPFDANAASNQIRARLREDGTIEHLLPPEYHCDPRNPEGCLCFQRFGWQMLEQMKEAGFSNVSALFYYSREYGYLGGEQLQFLAGK